MGKGLPRSLLPSGSSDFMVHLGRGRSSSVETTDAEEPIELQVDTILWLWVGPPDDDSNWVYAGADEAELPDDEDTSDEEESLDGLEVGTVCASPNYEEVPENALPL